LVYSKRNNTLIRIIIIDGIYYLSGPELKKALKPALLHAERFSVWRLSSGQD
jgi:hypothetical protein